MEKIPAPGPLNFNQRNLHEAWRRWKEELILFLQATENDTKPGKVQTSILLTCIGAKGRDIYSTFTFEPDADKHVLGRVVEKFDTYCQPRKNLTFLRNRFFTCRQTSGQRFDDYVTELRQRSKDCEFGDICDSLIRDILIIGITDNRLRERLLREANLTLDKAIQAGQASEETKEQSRVLATESAAIASIRNKQKNAGKKSKSNDQKDRQTQINSCKFCGGSHLRGQCPAYNKRCTKCNKKGHYSSCCFAKKSVRQVDADSADSSDSDSTPDDSEFFIGSINAHDPKQEMKSSEPISPNFSINSVNTRKNPSRWSADLDINGTTESFKVDSGAEANVLPDGVYKTLYKRPKLKPTSVTLTNYDGTAIPVLGKCVANVTFRNTVTPLLFIVADTESQPIIGADASEKLQLIKRIFHIDSNLPAFLEKYSDCFGDLGTLKNTHHITVDPSVPPVVNPPRRVPFAMKDKLKAELDRMTKLGVIKPVHEPTDWVNSLVTVERPNGKLRVCIDPRHLNKAIKRQHYNMPTAEEIFSDMHGAKYFCKIDASNGYWQVPVDEESSNLLAFNSPFGRFKFTRMPFGIHSASEVFQREVAQIIEGLEGTRNNQDDIIIWATTIQEMYERLERLFERLRKSGLKLNREKCQFFLTELLYIGHLLTADGIKPDPSKVEAITKMPNPKSKQDLQRFLGMTNYLCKFVPNYSEVTAPLRLLLQNDVEWSFDQPQIKAIEDLKRIITSEPVLQFYNPELPTKVSTDASKFGLGAVLEQKHGDEWKPEAFASRATTPAEQNYCPLEREALSVLFGCKRFHQYVYGHHFDVENDHKPLLPIFQKSITKAPPRIQRFMLALQRYDFDLKYIPGKDAVVPDALSRAYLDDCDPEISEEDLEAYVHQIVSEMPISDKKLIQYRQSTASDETLQLLAEYTSNGWPIKSKIPKPVRQYYNVREDITAIDGLLLKGHRIIIPSELRSEVRNLIHAGHQGMDKCMARAREHVFWPGITSEIKDMCQNCSACLDERNQQPPEPLIEHDIPESPWTKVATDTFTLFRKPYLLVVDYTSKFFDVQLLPDKESPTVINHLKSSFAKFGIPQTVFSDGGPEYTSNEFEKFAKDWDFDHDSSSALFPQSNGLVERTVQTVKRTLRKAIKSKQDPYLALLALRTTPLRDAPSPACQLMGRKLRTTMPSIEHQTRLKKKQPKSDRGRTLTDLKPGDPVRVHYKNSHKWEVKGKVVEKLPQPRSYLVETERGTKVRRNRRHLLKTNENVDLVPEDDIYEDIVPSDLPPTPHTTFLPATRPVTSTDTASSRYHCTTRSGRDVNKPDFYKP